MVKWLLLMPPRCGATDSWTTMWVLPALLVLPLSVWGFPLLWSHKIAWWWVSQQCQHFIVEVLSLNATPLHEQVVRWVSGSSRIGQSLSSVQFPPPSEYPNTQRAVLKGPSFHLRSFRSPFSWSPMLVAGGRLLPDLHQCINGHRKWPIPRPRPEAVRATRNYICLNLPLLNNS